MNQDIKDNEVAGDVFDEPNIWNLDSFEKGKLRNWAAKHK